MKTALLLIAALVLCYVAVAAQDTPKSFAELPTVQDSYIFPDDSMPHLSIGTLYSSEPADLLIIGSASISDPMVRIHMNGEIEYGSNYKPDEAAKIFWEAIGHYVKPCKAEEESK